MYIKISKTQESELIPYDRNEIGDEVVYKNGNGNWYKGVVEEREGWKLGMMANNKIYGFIVDYGDISLIQRKHVLFFPPK